MSGKNFIIACPSCGKYAEANSGFFAKKKIPCSCGHVIDVRTEKMASLTCSNCNNDIIYDQSKGEDACCPVCGTAISITKKKREEKQYSVFHCANCGCELSVEKGTSHHACPLCDTEIDVHKQVEKEKVLKKGVASIVKFDGADDVIAWKHPLTSFNKGSQCIVREGQEALFLKDGKAQEPFKPGRYTLSYEDCPQLEFLRESPDGGDHTFHSEVYFINTTTQMGIRWGTDSKMRLFDPGSGLHIEIGACGSFNLRVVDSAKLLSKVIGTSPSFQRSEIADDTTEAEISLGLFGISWSIKQTTGKFKDVILNAVKGNLARTIKQQDINILEIDEYLDVLGASLKGVINEALNEYGLEVTEFFVNSVVTPDDDPDFRRLKKQFAERVLLRRDDSIKMAEAESLRERKLYEAETAAQIKAVEAQGAGAADRIAAEHQAEISRISAMAEADVIRAKGMAEADAYKAQAMAEAMEMQAKGYNYQDETARMVGMEAMKNGLGQMSSLAGDIAGIGMGMSVMDSVREMTRQAMGGAPAAPAADGAWTCAACGATGITSKFCPECGAKKPEDQTWACAACGATGITSRFCPECGAKKPGGSWTCPKCGTASITSKFCPECGTPKV